MSRICDAGLSNEPLSHMYVMRSEHVKQIVRHTFEI